MRTTTVRLEDHWADMVETVARRDGCRPADVLREAVRRYMVTLASDDASLNELMERALEAALAESEERVRRQFGASHSAGRAD